VHNNGSNWCEESQWALQKGTGGVNGFRLHRSAVLFVKSGPKSKTWEEFIDDLAASQYADGFSIKFINKQPGYIWP
jgi:hypothetical protein